jgi:hypothetical protein
LQPQSADSDKGATVFALWRRGSAGSRKTNATIGDILALLRKLLEANAETVRELKYAAAEAREAKAECRVLSLILSCLLAHVADELSGRQTLDVVLGEAERLIDAVEAEHGDAPEYRNIIRRIRADAELRFPKPR